MGAGAATRRHRRHCRGCLPGHVGCWGWIELYRDRSDEPFSDLDVEVLADIAPDLGLGLRRQLMIQTGRQPAVVRPPGVLVLDHDLAVRARQRPRATGRPRYRAPRRSPTGACCTPRSIPLPRWPGRSDRTGARHAPGERRHMGADRGGDPGGRRRGSRRDPAGGRTCGDLRPGVPDPWPDTTRTAGCRAFGRGEGHRRYLQPVVPFPYTLQDHLKSVFAKLGVHTRTGLVTRLSDPGLDRFT